ncbi:histidine kinase N-terminal domain-containing protein, partial [Oerskovia sp. NPDC060287]|uniref:histidine kinase N-terminal domain-containing protein n=1 Tax=Oerskovia sp. NPDC060287 TaxID=3347095 RepID=UPI00364DA92B
SMRWARRCSSSGSSSRCPSSGCAVASRPQHLLVSEWQLLSDLSFADLILWVPTRDGTRYVSVAQMRPNTGPTSYQNDMVGHLVPRGRRPMLDLAPSGTDEFSRRRRSTLDRPVHHPRHREHV